MHRYLYKLYSEKQFGNIYNPDKAFYHVQFVSDLGGHDATAALASFYANGMGTDVDKVQAVKWAFIATCQFQRGEVLDLIKGLYAEMPEETYAEGRQMAMEWIKSNGGDNKKKFRTDKTLIDPITGSKLEFNFDSTRENDAKPSPQSAARQDALIEKWLAHCKDESSADVFDFQSLLIEDPKLTDEKLSTIFQYYDCRSELIERFKLACDCRLRRSASKLDDSEIEANARADLLMKFDLCKASAKFDEFEELEHINESLIQTVEVKKVNKEEFDNQRYMSFYEIVFEVMGEHLDKVKIAGQYGLREALYGVLKDNDLVHYVMSAFLDDKPDFGPYLALCNAGVLHDLAPEHLLICKHL